MGRKRYSAEQIINKLREAEVLLAKGQKASQVCRKLGVTENTYYRWRREYGGLRIDQAKRLKELVAKAAKEDAAPAKDTAPTEKRRSRRNGRKPLPKELKRERTVLDLADEEKVCPCCEQALTPIGEDVTEVLEYVPASFVVKEIVRPKYACKTASCRGTVKSASLPPMPIEKGRPGPGLLAHVITSKYVDNQPLCRQSAIFARDGVDLHRSTLCEWTDAAGELLRPVAMAMWHRIKARGYLQADEAPAISQNRATRGPSATACSLASSTRPIKAENRVLS